MKYHLYCQESGFEFEHEVDSLEASEIRNIVAELFSDEIYDCIIFSNPLAKKCQGFFPDPWAIETELHGIAKANLKKRFGGKVFVKTIDNEGDVISNRPVGVFDEIIEDIEEREQGTINTGRVIIEMLKCFLKEGIWQYGFQRNDGTILTDTSQWPKHAEDGAGFIWQDSKGVLQPVIWFGLKNESPIDCWTLDKTTHRFDLLEVYDNPYSRNTRSRERWNLFWFSTFWELGWNALFDNNGDTHITWMFEECGMDEPSEEFYAVRDSCPIELSEKDTVAETIRKIDQFFADKENQTKTEHSGFSN